MPGLESMRRRLSSIAKPTPGPTTPPSHTQTDKRLLDPDFFNIDAEDLTWFHKVNLAVRRDIGKLILAHDYMHIQRVTVAAYQLYQTDASQVWAHGVDYRTVIVAAMVSSLGAVLYAKDHAENLKGFGPSTSDSPDVVQNIHHELLFDFLRRLDCPPDVAGPAALMASLISFTQECRDREKIKDSCEAYPALRFVQDAVRLDELGCVGIARLGTMSKTTILEAVNRMDTRLCHYVELMKTKTGRKEAERRWAQMLEFREGLLLQVDCSVGLEAGRRKSS
ncbi:uncharacterized protein M421DRAFT_425455 [Didymella exigua CBS 183.55]|uniref:Uncharacterized protein n=1 Tax=Didymella exigua CBS 183.55 TaxID=1150837 RepID=A0A6A5R7N0_9PLEO|nr:uncharacterized protein M421DRAFT_425455 [Didymella exigua CBS 183.55]KAF1923752.1 hypothetical protein M421DRAFT_425455 [Didymella exigua CBS 183.55]